MVEEFMHARRTTRPALSAAGLFLAAGLVVPSLAAAQQSERFDWQGRLSPGQTLEIRGINGKIEASGAEGDTIEVVATKHARRHNPAEVRIEVVEHGEGVTICAVYPSPDDAPNECRGRMNVRDNDVQVDFTVRVPAGLVFRPRTVNGAITAHGIAGAVYANTVNGAIEFSTTGRGVAKTVNGSIKAAVGEMGSENVEFSTVNGSITLGLPATANVTVDGATVNGAIQSDFPLTVEGKWGPKRAKGNIGQGGPTLKLKTVNGEIIIRRAA
jgi:hypothetical protein